MTTGQSLTSSLEALLFVSGEPLSLTRLSKTLGADEQSVEQMLLALSQKYAGDTESGLMIILKDRKATLSTKPENASYVEALTKAALAENLSKAALEVLSIIAYRAPITRAEIEAIRGVNCSFTLRNLLLRDLIERSGNPVDARGYVYAPTFRFLQFLGLKGTGNLPDYETLSRDERLEMILENEDVSSGTQVGQSSETT